MIGRRSNSNWFARLSTTTLLAAALPSAIAAERLNWSVVAPKAAQQLAEKPQAASDEAFAFPSTDWFQLPEVMVAESVPERWPEDAVPEVLSFADDPEPMLMAAVDTLNDATAPQLALEQPAAEAFPPIEAPVFEVSAIEIAEAQEPQPVETTPLADIEPMVASLPEPFRAFAAPVFAAAESVATEQEDQPEQEPEQTESIANVEIEPALIPEAFPAITAPVFEAPAIAVVEATEVEEIAEVAALTIDQRTDPQDTARYVGQHMGHDLTHHLVQGGEQQEEALANHVFDESYSFTGWAMNEPPQLPGLPPAADPVVHSPWDEVEFFGPVAALGDIEVLSTDESLESQVDDVLVEPVAAAQPLEASDEAQLPGTTDLTELAADDNSLLNEKFLVENQVLEDAAKTEYLEDLGLLEVADSRAYSEITTEIAETGLALPEADDEVPAEHEPSFRYEDLPSGPPELSLDDILELALANNPEVGSALAREEQAQWMFREAQVYKYPTVDVIAEAGPEYNRQATNSSHNEDITPGRTLTFRINQLLYDGGVSLNESDRRLQVRRSTELETRLIIEDIVAKAAEFYSQVLQHQRAAAVAEEFVAEMQSIVDKLEVMYESGAASKLELDFAKARLASARAETGNTQAQLNDALSNLVFLTGDLPDFTAVPPRDIHAIDVLNLSEYIEIARKQNAEVLLNKSNRKALRYKIRAQKAQFSPILSINLKSEALADEGGNLDPRNTTEVKLKAEYFMFDGGARKARLNKTKAQLKELDWEDERLYKEVDRQVKQAYNQITTNRLTLDATEDEIASNQELRRLNRQNLEMGEISIIELIEVEERLFNSQATWYRVSSEMFKNYYELLVSAGELSTLIGASELTQSRIEDEPVAPALD